MGKTVRASAVLAASVLAVPLWAVPSAVAAETSEPAAYGAYFSATGIDKPDAAPAAPPNVISDSGDGVGKGNLAVASKGGADEDKVSFLFFTLTDVPLDATVDKAVLTVPLVPDAPPTDVSAGASPELVRVCKSGAEGFFGEDGTAIALAPSRLCEEFASEPGTANADGTAYEFDVTGLAAQWLTANDGLALTVADGAAQPFQVVFAPADQATLAVTYSGGSSALAPELPADTFEDSGEVPLAGGFGFEDGGTSLPSFDTGGFGTVSAPLVDTPLPDAAAPEPTAPEPVLAGGAARPVAALTPASGVPSPGFWAGLALLAGVGVLLSLVLGDSRVAVPAGAGSTSRLSQALSGRSTGPRPSLARPQSA